MIIKVCGMKHSPNIRELDTARLADWMGFIFHPESPRYVDARPSYLPRHSKRVGVFVNAQPVDILLRQQEYGLDLIQLHGHESPACCRQLRQLLGSGVGLMKMIPVSTAADLRQTSAYTGAVDYFLFETKTPGHGGSGQQFDWTLLHHYTGPTPFLLTGGIGPDDAGKLLAFSHPRLAGIDLNSRFETAPGQKDIQSLRKFIQSIKSYEQNQPTIR